MMIPIIRCLILIITMVLTNLAYPAQISDWNNGSNNPQRNGLSFVNGPEAGTLL